MKTLKTTLIMILALSSMHIFAADGDAATAGVGQQDEACGGNSHCGQCIDTSGRGNNEDSSVVAPTTTAPADAADR